MKVTITTDAASVTIEDRSAYNPDVLDDMVARATAAVVTCASMSEGEGEGT